MGLLGSGRKAASPKSSSPSPSSSSTPATPTKTGNNYHSSHHHQATPSSSSSHTSAPSTPSSSILSRSVPTISISTPDAKYNGTIEPSAVFPDHHTMAAAVLPPSYSSTNGGSKGAAGAAGIASANMPWEKKSAAIRHEANGTGGSEGSSSAPSTPEENESQPPSLTTGSTSPSIESLESVQDMHNAKALAAVRRMQQNGKWDEALKDPSLASAAAQLATQQKLGGQGGSSGAPPSSFDSSADGTQLLHSEFGYCANQDYRYTSQHRRGDPLPEPVEEEPSYFTVITTYFSYLILIIIGHIHDTIGKYVFRESFLYLVPHNGYAPLLSDSSSFYTRNLKRRLDDCFSRPVTGVCGRTVVLLDRTSQDYYRSFEFTGTRTRALNVSAYNYLGFAQSHGGCADAVEDCLRTYGVSSYGSRLGAGFLDLQQQAERLVARFVGHDDATVISMGFATNSTTIPAITSPGTLIISDEYNHASIRFGARLSGAHIRQYKHNDMHQLESLLRECISQGMPRTHRPWKKILLIVEGLYSMEGTLVNLPELIRLKEKYKVRFPLHSDVVLQKK